MAPLRIIIVDDEKRVRNVLKKLITYHYPDADIVAEADCVEKATDVINLYCPDLVLLDIKMPDGTGFDLLNNFKSLSFKVIIVTAHDDFGIQAVKWAALDYLLKPIVPDELVLALRKAAQQINNENIMAQLGVFMENVSSQNKEIKKIAIYSHDKIQVLSVNEIVRCEADRSYSVIFLQNNKKFTDSRPLKEYETLLTPLGFFRPHNSHLVNISFIERMEKKDGGMLIMKDNSKVPVSSRRYKELIEVFSKMKIC